MSEESFSADRIEVTVRGTFKTEHVFLSSSQVLGKLALNAAKSEGFFLGLDESQLAIHKTSFWRSEFKLSQDGRTLANASPQGALKRAFDIRFEGALITLKPGGKKLRSWTVRDSQGAVLCEFLPRKSLKRGARIRIGAEIPLALVVLCYVLVIRRWQEESSAA